MRLYARESKVETPQTGLFSANAIPLTALTLIRSPVNEPGPFDTAKPSISPKDIPAVLRRLSISGINVCE
jgi:hypothetical protein